MDNTNDTTPLTNGENGSTPNHTEEKSPIRDNKGRFLPGNPGGPGNPQAHNIAAWRKALADSISADDIADVAMQLLDAAKAGKPWAIRELLDRCMGKSRVQIDFMADDLRGCGDYSEHEKKEARRIAAILVREGVEKAHRTENPPAVE